MLEESGRNDSASAPDDSFPGQWEGITKVTSTCGSNAPITSDPLLST